MATQHYSWLKLLKNNFPGSAYRPRVLLIAEAANPEWVSVPLIGWSLARALAGRTEAHLVTQVRNREAITRTGLVEDRDFTIIDSERVASWLYQLADKIRGGRGVGWTTVAALSAISYYYFEILVWKKFGPAIRRGDFDIVHRITPLSPTTPSLIAKKCAAASTPFVIGPLNGGVPWPAEFSDARRKEREWLSYVRGAYKFLPASRSTLAKATAIIVGSRSTEREISSRYRSKCVYLPENAIDPARFSAPRVATTDAMLHACFVGRLVPYKGPDILLEAVQSLVRAGRLRLDVIGDGPLMRQLADFVVDKQLSSGVTLHGWVSHTELQMLMRKSQVMLFPSIREFGGGVVLEAMALGIVPVVVDYAGPGELVSDQVGFKVALGTRDEIVRGFRDITSFLTENQDKLAPMSRAAQHLIRKCFTWDKKAMQVIEIYRWAAGKENSMPRFFDAANQCL